MLSTAVVPFYIPTSSVRGLQFLHILTSTLFSILKFYYYFHPGGCKWYLIVGFVVLLFGCTGPSLLCSLSLAAESRGCSLVVVPGLPLVVASVVGVHWLSAHGLSTCLKSVHCSTQVSGFVVLGLSSYDTRLSCSAACGISSHQGLTLCPLHWQADSYPLYHLGSPHCGFDVHLLKEEGL